MESPHVPAWTPPEVFEEYRLVRLLGSGAMGRVYLARDQLLDRLVAIKFVADDVPSVLARERFLREARAVARIQHPNVVAVYRTGVLDDRPYLISEFVRGESLDRLKIPLPWRRAADLALGLAAGLGAVHRHGILHRDVKLANAILTELGEVKLLDFGLAKLLHADGVDRDLTGGEFEIVAIPSDMNPADTVRLGPTTSPSPANRRTPLPGDSPSAEGLTLPGTMLGTPLYMAPELWRGEPATARSDVYALGVVLFELFGGRAPFLGQTLQTLMIKVFEGAPSLTTVAQDVPMSIVGLVDRCLAEDPSARFSSGEDLRTAIEDALAAPRASTSASVTNPYVGLAAFQPDQRTLFFGRSYEIRTLLDRLKNDRVVIVAGDSGVGKSSLCRAGVLPALEQTIVITIVPGRSPLEMLESAIASASPGDGGRKLEPGEILRRLTKTSNVVLFVDQVEELVTQAHPGAARAFAEALVLFHARTPRLRILASVRSDYLTRVAALGFDEDLMRGLYLLRPLTEAGVRDAIVGPARAMGVELAPDMVEDLVKAGVQHGSLPLLQFALSELWEKQDRSSKEITTESLDQIGGVEGALNRHADQVFDALPHPQREIAQRVLTRLVTAEGTRASLTSADVPSLGDGATAVVDALVRARLLLAREAEGTAIYELAHESMIRTWARIRSWLGADADRKQMQERIGRAAAEWRRLGHDDALWGEAQLAELARFEPIDLDADRLAFLAASRRGVRRRRAKRWARRLSAPFVIAVAVGAANLESRWSTRTKVDAIAERARTDIDRGEVERRRVEERLAKAFEAFVSFDAEKGGEAYESARADARRVDALLSVATGSIAAAQSIDPLRDDLRGLLVHGLTERARLARALGQDERFGEIVLQLGDAGRPLIDAPARVVVTTVPAGARVFVARYGAAPGQAWPLGPERALGAAPLSEALPPGSHLLRIELPGFEPVRHPVMLEPGEDVRIQIPLLSSGSVPAGFAYVPPGRFLFGSADPKLWKSLYQTAPLHRAQTGAYFIAVHETTNAEWIRYLDALPASERARLSTGAQLAKIGDVWTYTLQGLAADREGPRTFREREPVEYERRKSRQRQNWMRLPAAMIAGTDARAYAKWLHESGILPGARLCTDLEWERAARGADARLYTTGDAIGPMDANLVDRYPEAVDERWGADEVGSQPGERSPFGVDDLTGNVMEYVASSLERDAVVARGASWQQRAADAVLVVRWPYSDFRDPRVGVRLCADVPNAEPARLR